MPRTRIKLEVYVDLDPTPGAMHEPEDARHAVGMILNDRIPHYHPSVRLEEK
jgi:hypothetical protein